VSSQNGTGALVTSGLTAGNFVATAANGRGIVGDAQATTGNGYGGVFATRTTGGGAGVFARAIGANNTGAGLVAENTASTGKALVARNTGNDHAMEAGTPNDSLLTKGRFPRHEYASGAPRPMVPIAYGYVNLTGTVASGSGNFTVTKISTGVYEIDVSGVSGPYSSMTVVATPFEQSAKEICTVGDPILGDARIQVFNLTDNALKDSDFNFVIYRAAGLLSPPASLQRPDMGRARDMEEWQRQDPAGFERHRRAFQEWERSALALEPHGRTSP
jgi:hypothetical protein